MNWTDVIEIIEKYWVQQVCVLAVGIVTWWYRRSVKKLKEGAQNQKALRAAMMALQRDRFYEGYRRHMRDGYFPIQDREVMQDIYDQYHALGGNGVITHLMEDQDDQPTFPE